MAVFGEIIIFSFSGNSCHLVASSTGFLSDTSRRQAELIMGKPRNSLLPNFQYTNAEVTTASTNARTCGTFLANYDDMNAARGDLFSTFWATFSLGRPMRMSSEMS